MTDNPKTSTELVVQKPAIVAVLGAGSWGTALAQILARRGHTVTIWGRETEIVDEINASHSNEFYFPGVKLNPAIRGIKEIDAAVRGAEAIVVAVPSVAVRSVIQQIKQHIQPGAIVISAAKGLEGDTLKTMSAVIEEELGSSARVAALSGPSFAAEVIREYPTAVAVAARTKETAETAAKLFHQDIFRAYTSTDLVGVEIGGAIKNVIALAVGVVDGVGMGLNARAGLITRGLAEIQRLVVGMGGERQTVSGLSGLGDLLLTATGDLSRNRQVGLRLGRGEKLDDIISSLGQVAEAVVTAPKALELARKLNIDAPLTEEVVRVLRGERSINESVKALLSRAQKAET